MGQDKVLRGEKGFLAQPSQHLSGGCSHLQMHLHVPTSEPSHWRFHHQECLFPIGLSNSPSFAKNFSESIL